MASNTYLDFISKVEKIGKNRTRYHIGNNFIIDVSIVEHDKFNKYDLMKIWSDNGYVKTFLSTHIDIMTYFTDCDGNCWGYYNIQDKPNHKIDFDYILEATQENINLLLSECIRMREMDIRHK